MDDIIKYFDLVKKSNSKGTYDRFNLLAAYLIQDYPELGQLMFELLDLSRLEDWDLQDDFVYRALQAYRKENNL